MLEEQGRSGVLASQVQCMAQALSSHQTTFSQALSRLANYEHRLSLAASRLVAVKGLWMLNCCIYLMFAFYTKFGRCCEAETGAMLLLLRYICFCMVSLFCGVKMLQCLTWIVRGFDRK